MVVGGGFRVWLAILVAATVIERWSVLDAFYTDDGILPVAEWRAETGDDWVVRWVCLHAWSGSLGWQRALSVAQVGLAALIPVSRVAALGSLWLYVSVTIRLVSSAFILDRYVMLELLLAACDESTPFWRLQLLWIYADAGWAKWRDPGWSRHAELPALDAYVRHGAAARQLRRALGVRGLRVLTPLVPVVELGAPAIAHFAYYVGDAPKLGAACVALVCAMHVGIALSMNGAGLLSLAAVVAWLPVATTTTTTTTTRSRKNNKKKKKKRSSYVSRFVVPGLVALACVWFAASGQRECLVARAAPLKAILHNRWNVFGGSDPTVTWEIFPARLADGTMVDLWARGANVSWAMPEAAPRGGRWRTFPMLVDETDRVLDLAYSYFCREWNRPYPDRPKVLHFHAYMLQADVRAPEVVAKRLLRAQKCTAATTTTHHHLK